MDKETFLERLANRNSDEIFKYAMEVSERSKTGYTKTPVALEERYHKALDDGDSLLADQLEQELHCESPCDIELQAYLETFIRLQMKLEIAQIEERLEDVIEIQKEINALEEL